MSNDLVGKVVKLTAVKTFEGVYVSDPGNRRQGVRLPDGSHRWFWDGQDTVKLEELKQEDFI